MQSDTCAVDGRMFASGFSVVSKNALLCGGSNEIAFDGEDIYVFLLFESLSGFWNFVLKIHYFCYFMKETVLILSAVDI